jgi:hypothetical protein
VSSTSITETVTSHNEAKTADEAESDEAREKIRVEFTQGREEEWEVE